MSEQVKGIPQDLREFYEFLTQDYFVKQGIGHAEMEIKPILAIIERIARSEQALVALEADWWVRLGKFRMALHAANLHGHYNLLQEHFEGEAGKWEELQQQVAALESRNRELESALERFIREHGMSYPMRRDALTAARAALKGAS